MDKLWQWICDAYSGARHSYSGAISSVIVEVKDSQYLRAELYRLREKYDELHVLRHDFGNRLSVINERLNEMRKQFDWYENVFNGPDHEFQHWWRVELVHEIEQMIELAEGKEAEAGKDGERE